MAVAGAAVGKLRSVAVLADAADAADAAVDGDREDEVDDVVVEVRPRGLVAMSFPRVDWS